MSLIVWSLVATLSGAAGMSVSDADVHVEDRVEYYPIEGRTARDLVAQMDALGPIRSVTGRRASGYTASEVLWEHSREMHEGTCRVRHLDVSVTIVTTLPKWVAKHREPGLTVRWKGFMANLLAHEATHREHMLLAAAAVRRAILAIPPQSDCRSLERAIDRAARQQTRHYAAESRKYDALTDFGAKQGVRLDL